MVFRPGFPLSSFGVAGRQGKNIAADLQMEHLNRLVKQSIKTLGPNKTEKVITRIGRAIGTIDPVLQVFDQENSVQKPSGAHHIAGYERDRNIIVSELRFSPLYLGECIVLFPTLGTFFMPKKREMYRLR